MSNVSFNVPSNDTIDCDDSETLSVLKAQSLLLATISSMFLVIGVPGNLLTIVVLNGRALKDNVFSIYLSSNSLFNIINLLTNCPRFFVQAAINRDLYFTNDAFCILFRLFALTVSTISSWHLIVITAARLMYVLERTKRFIQVHCYPIHVILAMCVIVTVIQVPIAYNWLRFEDEKGEAVLCYQTSQSSMVYIQILFQTVIPAVGIVSLNFWLLAIHQSSAFGLVKSASSSRVRQNLVNLLAMSSIQYLVSMLPMCIYFPNERHFFNLSEKLGKAKAQLTYSLTLLMIYSNNATNFVTYCFFGRRFRIEFLRIIRALTCTGLQSFNLDTPQTISPSITRPTIDYSSAETMTESKVDEAKPKVHEIRSSEVLHSFIRNVHTNIKRIQTKSRTATIDYSSAETMTESKVDEAKPKVHETRSSKALHSFIRNVHTNIKWIQTKSQTVTSSVTDLFNAGKMEEMKACETTSRRVREGISSMTRALQAFFRNLHTNIKGIQTKSQTATAAADLSNAVTTEEIKAQEAVPEVQEDIPKVQETS